MIWYMLYIQTEVQSKLEDICNRLSADQSICLNLVQTKTKDVFSKLVQNLVSSAQWYELNI